MTKTETKSTVLVKHHLKTLKLPTMHAECEKIAARAAQENLDHGAQAQTPALEAAALKYDSTIRKKT
jgi:hypothetical protein